MQDVFIMQTFQSAGYNNNVTVIVFSNIKVHSQVHSTLFKHINILLQNAIIYSVAFFSGLFQVSYFNHTKSSCNVVHSHSQSLQLTPLSNQFLKTTPNLVDLASVAIAQTESGYINSVDEWSIGSTASCTFDDRNAFTAPLQDHMWQRGGSYNGSVCNCHTNTEVLIWLFLDLG